MSEVNELVAEVIKEVEWITVDFGGSWGVIHYCPICEQEKKHGHSDDCEMGRVVEMLKDFQQD